MNKTKKVLALILVLTMLFYSLIAFLIGSKSQARERTEDISNLVNYQEIYTAIQELKTSHPNCTFTILYTGLDWNSVIQNETTAVHTRSLVHNSLVTGNVSEWVCPICGTKPQDNGQWYCASDKTVSCKTIISELNGVYNNKSLVQNIICQYVFWQRLESRINIKQCLMSGKSDCI